VSLLVLVDSGGYPRPDKPPLAFRLGGIPGISWVVAHLDPRYLVEKTVRLCYADPSRLAPEVLERYYELTLRPGNRAAFGARTALPFEDRTSELRNLRMPVLILWGEKDALNPVASAKRFAADIPGSTLKIYPDLGHMPMEEDGARTVADVASFLRGR
jgi:pimeloyl-ACP methyl ester carboxylesterase